METERVQRNFELDTDQAEWLRVKAFEQRTSQAEIVRDLLEREMKKEGKRDEQVRA
jgi:hypothetical protein